MTDWGPSGQTVYERTYSRTKPNGERETWEDTIERVAHGNLALVHGDDESTWTPEALREAVELKEHMRDFRIIPAGRHLWATGIKGRSYLMNCWTAGWTERLSEHFRFTFMRLMEGGGVGANYSSHFLAPYGAPRRELDVHVVCDPEHPDYQDMLDAGLLSTEYDADWDGGLQVEDSREGWADALTDLLDTYFTDDEVRHRGRVFDVSRVRGKGSRLKSFGGTASGPLPLAAALHKVSKVLNRRVPLLEGEVNIDLGVPVFLEPTDAMLIDHAIAECVVAGGNRRSARMAMVRWDDPHVWEFLTCKNDSGEHWTTNISVEVDDTFTEALADEAHELHWKARQVHLAVTQAALTNGEPGYWNSTLSNHGEVEEVYCTNPCGEITLQMWEACCLGHVNLHKFAPTQMGDAPNLGGLVRAHELMTRFLIRATYADISDEKSQKVEADNRRIGVGHLGVQAYLALNGYKMSDVALRMASPGYNTFRSQLQAMYRAVRNTARQYAFQLRIPEPVKVTTVAPTGSVAKLPGTTEGIHPIYARHFERRIRFSLADADQRETVTKAHEDGFEVEEDQYDSTGNTGIVVYPTKDPLVAEVEAMGRDPKVIETAEELGIEAALAFQAMYQKHYADNAVSFTVNVPAEDHQNEALAADPFGTPPAPSVGRVEKVAKIIATYLPALKGTTIMLDGSRPQSPYTRLTEEEYEAAEAKRIEDSVDLDCSRGACPI